MRHEIVKSLCLWSNNANINFQELKDEEDERTAHLRFTGGLKPAENHQPAEKQSRNLYEIPRNAPKDAAFMPHVLAHAFPPPTELKNLEQLRLYGDVHINMIQEGFWKSVEDIDDEGVSFRHIKSRPKDKFKIDLPAGMPEKGLSFVIAHEVGHSLGFPHSSSTNSLMYNKKSEDLQWSDRQPYFKDFRDKLKLRMNYGKRLVPMDNVCKDVWEEGKPYCEVMPSEPEPECKKRKKGYECWCRKTVCGVEKMTQTIQTYSKVLEKIYPLDCTRLSFS